MAVDVELTAGTRPNGGTEDFGLQDGQQWIENEFWNQLPGAKERPGNKITWGWKSDPRQHLMRVEVDGKQEACEISDETVKDCLADKGVQQRLRKLLKQLADSLTGGIR